MMNTHNKKRHAENNSSHGVFVSLLLLSGKLKILVKKEG